MRHSYLDYMRRVLDAGDRHLDGLITPLSQAEVRAIRKMHRLPEMVNEANLTGGDNVGGGTMNLDAGENIGGSTAAPAAPEVAGDDDDGDGDGDPDPDRRPQRRSTRSTAPLPPAQLSRPKAACALLGIGRTKLHHLSERDPRFPRKIVLGPRCVGWRTDALLDYLRLCEQEG